MKIASLSMSGWKSYERSAQIDLGEINIIVGPNNSGKSAVLRAIGMLQDGMETPPATDVHIGTDIAKISLDLADLTAKDIERHFGNPGQIDTSNLTIVGTRPKAPNGPLDIERGFVSGNARNRVDAIPSSEPRNFIYPYFARRKVFAYDGQIDWQRTIAVSPDLRNLPAKVLRLSDRGHVDHVTYSRLCMEVLGFRVSAYPGENNNQRAGISVGRYDHIPIEAMGDGVPSIVGLIVNLCMADRNLFLIEEPENDIHPEALKKLLHFIIELSEKGNQFIITTHSNVVVKNLGSSSRLFQVGIEMSQGAVPKSSITPIENTPTERIAVLRQLGYELYDSDLYEGWLILEESSAESIIRGYLIPWFVPRLARIRTVAAGGVDKAAPTFEDFRRLFLFLHLEQQYRDRVWVVLDGDAAGTTVVDGLRETYVSWRGEHFHTWSKGDFEEYYPARFAERVGEVLSLPHGKKRKPKRELLKDVQAWCDADPGAAKEAFKESAHEVIEFLNEVDRRLVESGNEGGSGSSEGVDDD